MKILAITHRPLDHQYRALLNRYVVKGSVRKCQDDNDALENYISYRKMSTVGRMNMLNAVMNTSGVLY